MERYTNLRNVTDLLSDGKIPYERRFGKPFKGPIIPFGSLVEYCTISAKDQSRIHQFGKKVLPGLFLGCALCAGRIWKGDVLIADIEELETMDASEIYAKRLNAKGRNISQRKWKIHILQEWETTQNGCKVRCAQGRELFSLGSDLSSRRLCEEKYVTVMSTVPGCDVTTVQQHYKGSTSTPPRVARLCQIREASLVALRILLQIYACSHVSIVRLVQSIILVSRDFHSHSSPLYQLPSELVSLSSVPMPSIDLNLWNLSRPSAFVPMSLGFTSVLTDEKFPKYQILNE